MDKPIHEKQLLNFLEDRRTALEEQAIKFVSSNTYSIFNNSSSSGRQQPPRKKVRGRVLKVQKATPSCSYCQQAHYTYRCPILQKQTVEERYESVKQKHLCFNCLSHEHDVRSCPSKKTCKECRRKHHSMLHYQPSQAANPPTTEGTALFSRQLQSDEMFQTALVDVTTEKMKLHTRIHWTLGLVQLVVPYIECINLEMFFLMKFLD